MELYTVIVDGEERQYEAGTTYQQIAEEFQDRYENDIVLVFADGKLRELRKKVKRNCAISFVTTSEEIGIQTYRRSMCLMLVKAVHDVGGQDQVKKVRIHYSVSKGYYCTVEGNLKLDQAFLDQVEEYMKHMVEQRMPIKKRSVSTDNAVDLFEKYGMTDKAKLFEYRRSSSVNIYCMNEFEDYYYGYMVPDAGYLKYFKLYLLEEGFVP